MCAVISIHSKDIKEAGKRDAGDVPSGWEFRMCEASYANCVSKKFDGNTSIEYERDWENTVPDIAQCVGYVHGHSDSEQPPGARP